MADVESGVARASRPGGASMAARVGAGLLGGYAFVWGFITLGIALAVALGMTYAEAERMFYLLGFLVFAACVCGSVAASTSARAWGVLAGGGAVMTAVAWLVSRALL